MSPVAICGTDTPLDTPNPHVNYTALALARANAQDPLEQGCADVPKRQEGLQQ
jgi:hypothetical protein